MRYFTPLNLLTLLSLFLGILNADYYVCKDEDRNAACTKEYDPVCGIPYFLCLRIDCRITFPNRCEACSEFIIKAVTPGECQRHKKKNETLEFLADD